MDELVVSRTLMEEWDVNQDSLEFGCHQESHELVVSCRALMSCLSPKSLMNSPSAGILCAGRHQESHELVVSCTTLISCWSPGAS